MDKQALLDQAQQALTRYACKDMQGQEKEEMAGVVQRFFREQVSSLDIAVIFDQMATPMKALGWFNTYLCEKFRQKCCTNPVPELSDACHLS